MITTLLTSLHDTTTERFNQGFGFATEGFEEIINPAKKILKKIDKILDILLDSPHNIITIIIASVVSISSTLGLTLTIYIIKIMKSPRQKEEDAVKIAKEQHERWNDLEAVIRSQVQENSQERTKPQSATF